MKRIIIDTNALMSIAAFNLDIFTAIQESVDFSYQLFILDGTVDELYKIQKEQRGKGRKAAKLAFQIIDAQNIPLIKEVGYVDDLLVEHSKKGDLILTQDMALKKRLQKPYLTIRQKKKIIMIY